MAKQTTTKKSSQAAKADELYKRAKTRKNNHSESSHGVTPAKLDNGITPAKTDNGIL